MTHFTRYLPLGLAVGLLALAGRMLIAADDAPLPKSIDFDRDIRPILSNTCFTCHGPDDEKRKSGLRLDQRDVAIKPAKSGAIAIVPGKLDQSELVKRITLAEDDEDHMPPAKSNKHLSSRQVALLKQWVAEGASYKGHWAFTPPVRPGLPGVKDEKPGGWVRSPIDRFILAKLEAEGLSPSPEASKVTLLRRLYLDLIGLPPTIAEVDEYLKDTSPDSYEKQVEKLLASPHYGERWGRHWLDAARYADSDGFEKDKSRQVYFYRDYVINALNKDTPYDQFIIEQLAGDLLPHASQEQIVATGYLRNSMVNEEGGIDPEQFRMDEMFDRMDAVGKGILGLTIQCAQCHSHKYDPLTQEEYYRMFAFLNNDHEEQRIVYTPDEQMKASELTRKIRDVEGELRGQLHDWGKQMAAWEESVKNDQPKWTVLKLEHEGENDQRYLPQSDGSYLAQGYAPTKFTVTFKATPKLANITALRLEYLTDSNLPRGGPGRSFKGTCALSEFKVEVETPGVKNTKVKIVDATADFNQPEMPLEPNFDDRQPAKRITGPVKFAIDGDANTAWGIEAGPGLRNQDRKAVFRFEKPIGEVNSTLTIRLQQNHGGWNSDDHQNNNLGRFRISATTDAGDVKADPLPKRVRDIFAIAREKRTPAQVAEVFSYWRTIVPQWKEANARIDALWKEWPIGETSLTLLPRQNPRETHMLTRGDWLKPNKGVEPGVPAFLNPLPKDAKLDRLTFAKWLVDPKSPTTARVFVNRIWQAYFGIGIVSTSEDFGVQSDPPSHPQLLDWLACEFVENGWSIKHIHRLIVTSATYRQSSRVTPEMLARDPYNRLLARGSRFRVEGEIIRDIALSASGLLNPKVGGKSIMVPAPAFLFQPPASYAPFPYVDETGPDKYRRAIYTFRRRSTPFPGLQTFDVPNADQSCVRRQRSNSPLQALDSLNEPMFVECARALAKKTIEQGGKSDEERLTFAFRQALARNPSEAEMKELSGLLNKERQRFAEGFLNPNELTSGDAKPPADLPKGVTPTQWAAYTVVSRVILNLDETITKE